jgi:hypothetical protein
MWPIITGTELNGTINLWEPTPPAEETGELWTKAHEVALISPSSGTWTNVTTDASGEFIILANVEQAAIFVLHLKPGGGGFDCMSKWEIAHPILSFVPVSRKSSKNAEPNDGSELQVFCIQTKAIQKYSIHPKECIPNASALKYPR